MVIDNISEPVPCVSNSGGIHSASIPGVIFHWQFACVCKLTLTVPPLPGTNETAGEIE